MEHIVESLNADWDSFLRYTPKLIYAAVILGITLGASAYAGRLTAHLLQRTERFRTNETFLRRLVNVAVISFGVLLALGALGLHGIAASLFATGGIVAIVLGFAFKEIGENFLAGFLLSFSRPFELGDLIETGNLTGIVRTIDLRYVHVRTFDACDVYVPSAQFLREPLYNYTRDGLRRPGFTIGVAYEHEPAAVMAVLQSAIENVADVLEDPAPFVTIKEFSDQFVTYEIFFWLDVSKSERGFIAVRNAVKTACWTALRDAGLTFSSNVSSALEIVRAPELQVEVASR